jgi:tight adherence protein C
MEIMTLLLYGLIMLAVASAVLALYWGTARTVSPVDARLREINPRVTQELETPPVTKELLERTAKVAAKVTAQLLPPSPRNVRRLRRRLMQAGFIGENAVSVFTMIRLAAALFFPLATAVVLFVTRRPFDSSAFALLVIAACFGAFIPSFMLSRQVSKRQRQISKALADALDLMVVCVEAGLGLNAALQRVGKEIELVEPALSFELGITNREIRAGKPRDEALRNLGDRTGVDDIKSLVAMLVQTDRFGTSIADSLRVFADSMRIKRRQRAEEQVAKAAIKLIFPLLFCIFPALLIVLMGPALIKIYKLLAAVGQ